MAEEKILKEEELTDEQLEGVAGGTYLETFDDMRYVSQYTGFRFTGDDSHKREQLRDLLWQGGIQLKDHGGGNPNQYFVIDRNTGKKLYETDRDHALQYAVTNIINHT